MTDKCYFCGSDDILLPDVGIAIGQDVVDCSFCRRCLTENTAEEFWKQYFIKEGYSWPPEWEEEKPEKPEPGPSIFRPRRP